MSQSQLSFPGFGTWPWEPRRLVRSGDGDLIENRMASLRFKLADAQSSGKDVDEARASYRRKKHEADVFTAWTIEQRQAGALHAELTWGRCVEALGLRRT